jgi:hypothetical protein
VYFGFREASTWAGDIVDLMNDPIERPNQRSDGTFMDWGQTTVETNPADLNDFDGLPVIGRRFPQKSWEAWATVFLTIISIVISFPLIMSILTNMGELVFPALTKSTAVRVGWRSALVTLAIGLGLLLASTGKFVPEIGVLASLCLVPMQLILPILFFLSASRNHYGSFKKSIKKMGVLSFWAQIIILGVATFFVGIGLYGSFKDLVS